MHPHVHSREKCDYIRIRSSSALTHCAARHARDATSPVPGLNGQGDCEAPDPANTVTDRLNNLLKAGGPGYTLKLCPSAEYVTIAPIQFAAHQQEISTVGYPTDSTRATIKIMGPVHGTSPHAIGVDGSCADCNGIKLRNIQARLSHGPTQPRPLCLLVYID